MTTIVTPQPKPVTNGTLSPVAPIDPAPPITSTTVVEATSPGDEQLSPKFAALARQQKAMRRMQEELKAREAALKAKETDYETNYIPRSRLKEDAYGVLTAEGISYDSIVNAALSQDPTSQALKNFEKKITSVEDLIKQKDLEAQQLQKAQYDQALSHIRSDVKQLIDTDPSYEVIKANDAQEAVVALIEETFQKDGTLLTVEQASQKVEDYLFEQAVKMASLEKVKKKLTPEPVAPPAQAVRTPTHGGPQITQRHQPIATLTRETITAPSKPLTDKDRRARAIAAFRGQL